ncbi:hypothetical protein D1AOALGA4SA_3593 [Olavius algarvensis Delta 1 endosymbiont]|nr:hypothetical protein D1AOALGA4SA_3593 [Olavius algarvensis Delta 1 endosymbiont]
MKINIDLNTAAIGTTINGTLVWNFEFGLMEFVWILIFVAWNFQYYH